MGAVFDDARFADMRDLLPESACTLVAVLGLSDAREVIRNLGGTSVAIPKCRTRAGAQGILAVVLNRQFSATVAISERGFLAKGR